MAYVRGSQVQFILLPDMLAKAPYFNRIKLWRKFKGNAVFGGGAFINKAGRVIRPGASTTRPTGGGPPGGPPGGQFAPGVRDGGPRGPPGMSSHPYGAPRPMGGYGNPSADPRGGPQQNMGGYGYPPQQHGGPSLYGPPPSGSYGGPPPHQQQQQQYQQYR